MIKEISDFAESRNIQWLVHFTRAANLPSIMKHGIVPVSMTGDGKITASTNDRQRLDYQSTATCVSISFPNHRMFYKYRQEDESVDWIVLVLDKSILWKKPCAFCQRNAADALVTSIPIQDRMSLDAFSGLYQEIEGEKSRKDQRLTPSDPTHDQAEVLVFDIIEPRFIIGAAFNSDKAKLQYEHLLSNTKIVIHPKNGKFFGSRSFSR